MMSFFERIVDFIKDLIAAPDRIRDVFMRIVQYLVEHLVTTHYGCPNSNRTAKLQLKKRLYK